MKETLINLIKNNELLSCCIELEKLGFEVKDIKSVILKWDLFKAHLENMKKKFTSEQYNDYNEALDRITSQLVNIILTNF